MPCVSGGLDRLLWLPWPTRAPQRTHLHWVTAQCDIQGTWEAAHTHTHTHHIWRSFLTSYSALPAICMHFTSIYAHVFGCILHVNKVTFHPYIHTHEVTRGLDLVSSKSAFGLRGPGGWAQKSSECALVFIKRGKQSGDASWTFLELQHNPKLPLTQACRESFSGPWKTEGTLSCWLFKDNSTIFETWGLSEQGWSLLVVGTQQFGAFFFFLSWFAFKCGECAQTIFRDAHVHIKHVMWRRRCMCMREKLRQHTSKHIRT